VSYDVCLVIDAGGPEPVTVGSLNANYTYNCSVMLKEAVGVQLSDMHGWEARRVAEILRTAICDMMTNPAKYEALNPPNGWGDAKGWRAFLQEIHDASMLAPRATLDVH